MKRALIVLVACASRSAEPHPDLDALNAHVPAEHRLVAFELPHGKLAAPFHWRVSGNRVAGKDGSFLELTEGVVARAMTTRLLSTAYYVAKLADHTELEATDGDHARRFVVASPDHRRVCTARIAEGAEPFAHALIGACRAAITSRT